MSQTELLMKEITALPAAYVDEVIDFVGYLRQKASLVKGVNPSKDRREGAYKAIEELEGFGLARGSKLTLESFAETQKEEIELEEEQYRRLFRKEDQS
jgi:hypothetical protein